MEAATEGTLAPDLELLGGQGWSVALRQAIGRPLVLVFLRWLG